MKKSVKALLLVVCALVLVTGSVLGTMAYLTANTGAVENTFVVGNLFVPDDPSTTEDNLTLVLAEHKITFGTDGKGTLSDTEEVTANEYTVIPGVDLPKDPFVRTDRKLAMDAYLFIEVNDTTDPALTATVDTGNWTALNYTGSHGGKIYVLKSNNGIAPAGAKVGKTTILTNNKVTVANTTIPESIGKMDFYAYMIQAAGLDTAADAAAALGFTAVTAG